MILNSIRSTAPSRSASRSASAPSGTAAPGGFSPAASGRSAAAAPQRSVAAVASLDALVALQGIDGPLDRRARAARRGIAILDDLDDMKLAILEGRVGTVEIERLRRVVRSAREGTDDSELEALIDGIELRAEVEIAKLGG